MMCHPEGREEVGGEVKYRLGNCAGAANSYLLTVPQVTHLPISTQASGNG